MSDVTTTELDIKPEPVLVKPGNYPPREGVDYNRICDYRDLPRILHEASQSQVVAVDLETRGSDYSFPELGIVGVGLAWSSGSCYIPFEHLYTSSKDLLLKFLYEHTGLVAHNVYFDGGVLYSKYNQHPKWLACTLALYMQTANEGWVGQQWGLKSAQVDILGWPDSNEGELDEWLVTNGYYIGNRRVDNSPENLAKEYLEGKLRPDKAEMWRAPVEILGKYCCLDAESTYLLYTQCLAPVLDEFPALRDYHERLFLELIRVHIEQKMHGIDMDIQGLHNRRDELERELQQLEHKFRMNNEISSHLMEIEERLLSELSAKEPEQYKKVKPLPPAPPKYKKDGGISKNYEKWLERRGQTVPLELSLNWVNWQDRWQRAVRGELPEYRFNLQSGPQLRELFYTRLGHTPTTYTEKGEPKIGTKALKQLGSAGLLLVDHSYARKELSYIQDYLQRTAHRTTLHPNFRLPGTCTGRLSSKQPNLQQIPKSQAMMSLFRARPGHVWVDLDFSALEAVVATEFSQDPNMLLLYGEGAIPNDIHLFVAAHVPGAMGSKVLATGYTPRNPSRDGLIRAKKECKHERGIAKTVVYACQYGAGVNKVMSTLEEADIHLELSQVEQIHGTYWELFSGVKRFGYDLQREWDRNRGYVFNGLGRPMCVLPDYKKDLLNRFIQSTGHDILVLYISILLAEMVRRGIPYSPLLIDLHDATTVEVREQDAEATVEVFQWAMDELNRQLNGSIRMRGVPTVGMNMAQIKEPEE